MQEHGLSDYIREMVLWVYKIKIDLGFKIIYLIVNLQILLESIQNRNIIIDYRNHICKDKWSIFVVFIHASNTIEIH